MLDALAWWSDAIEVFVGVVAFGAVALMASCVAWLAREVRLTRRARDI